jgi:hypothetical protein
MPDPMQRPVWLEPLKQRLEEVLHPVFQTDAKAKLLTTLTGLAEILTAHRAEMPNDLVHYLERRSYEKAARFCEEGDAAACGVRSLKI